MKRLYFTIKLIAVLLVVDACLKCDEVKKPYFDFKSMNVSRLDKNREIPVGTEFRFVAHLQEVYYLASSGYSLDFISSSLAREECNSNGYLGYKHGLDSVCVKSSNNWDSLHPAGESLNDIVYLRQWWTYDEEYKLLSEADGLVLQEDKGSEFEIRTSPTEDLKHVFQLTYYKSNGETVEGFTDTITWVP